MPAFDPHLSLFQRLTNPNHPETVRLSEVVARIRSNTYAQHCAAIRSTYAQHGGATAGKAAISAMKKALPAVTLTGTFERRANKAWLQPSGCIGIDLDDLAPSALDQVWARLQSAPWVVLLFRSPSGSGIKGAVRVPSLATPNADAHQTHRTAWQAVTRWLDACDVQNDPAVRDLARLAFLAHDPDVYFNPQATVFPMENWSNSQSRSPVSPTAPVDDSNRTRPGDDFNQRGDIAALVHQHGWTLTRDGLNQHWCRPGKTDGTSATLKEGVWYVFSSSAAPFTAHQSYRAFAVYALLEHGGDYAAASAALRAQGYGAAEPEVNISSLCPPEQVDSTIVTDSIDPVDPGPIPDDLLKIPGFVGAVMDHCLATAPYPNQAMAFCGALSLQAFLAGRKVCEPGGLRTNLYLLGLAHSSSGKDWPRKLNNAILHAVDLAECVGDRFASAEGLQDSLFLTPAMLFQTDEIDGMLQAMNKSQDARYEGIMGALLTCYTSADSVVPMRRKAGQPAPGVIDQPCLVLFGTAIPNHYYGALSTRMLTNGLFARMMIVEGGKRSRGQDASPLDPPAHILNIAQFWADYPQGPGNLAHQHPSPKTVPMTDEARSVLSQCRHQADEAYAVCEAQDDSVGTTVWGRVNEQARRLALLYAVSADHQNPLIDGTAATWATRFARHQTKRMLFMASGHVSENSFDAERLRLLKKLRDAPQAELPHSVLLKRMKMKAKDFEELLATVLASGDVGVRNESTVGRNGRYYFHPHLSPLRGEGERSSEVPG